MNHSEQINELAAALVAAQAELRNPAFDSTNPHFKSKFASLATVRDTLTPVLTRHGLAVTQWPETDAQGHTLVTTMLTHASGQWMSSSLHVPTAKQDAHGTGSSITYARRYALMAALNVVGDEDDDANAAVAQPAYSAKIAKVAKACIAKHAAGDGWGAYEEASAITDAEEKIQLWDLLRDHSAVRSTIKEYAEMERNGNKATA